MDVKYIGRANYRIITEADMAAQGIEGFETTTWSKGGTESVLDAGGQWLIDHLKTEFVKGEASPTAVQTLSATSAKKSSSASTDSSSTPPSKS